MSSSSAAPSPARRTGTTPRPHGPPAARHTATRISAPFVHPSRDGSPSTAPQHRPECLHRPPHTPAYAAGGHKAARRGPRQSAPELGQWEGQDVPLVRPSSCIVEGGIPSSRRYLPTYLPCPGPQGCWAEACLLTRCCRVLCACLPRRARAVRVPCWGVPLKLLPQVLGKAVSRPPSPGVPGRRVSPHVSIGRATCPLLWSAALGAAQPCGVWLTKGGIAPVSLR